MPFDELVEEVDRLAGAGALGEDVICQGGETRYRMQHCEQFRARKRIDDLIAESSLVITHGGATVVELLMAHKPFVAFPNPRGAGDHQRGFLQRVASVSDISWSADVHDLLRLVGERRRAGPAVLKETIPRARDIVLRSFVPHARRF